jgi:chromosome segregation ATPase
MILMKPLNWKRLLVPKRELVGSQMIELTLELENHLATLKSKINLLEAQLQSEKERVRNVQDERDEAIRALSVAQNESERVKLENRALKEEIADMKQKHAENAKIPQTQRTSAAKERVKQRLEIERRGPTRESAHRDDHGRGDRSFIQVISLAK